MGVNFKLSYLTPNIIIKLLNLYVPDKMSLQIQKLMSKLSIEQTRAIKVLLSQIKGFIEVVQQILNNTSSVEHSRYISYREMARIHNDFCESVGKVMKAPALTYKFDLEKLPMRMDTLWGEQKKILESVLVSSKMLYSSVEGNLNFVDDEFENLENFISSRLRSSVFRKPEKEQEIQDVIETLLIGKGMSKGSDYDRETGKIEFSGKEFIPDFIINNLGLCIEVKLLRQGKKSSIIEEICADITAYSTAYSKQLFVIYDLGVIQNEYEFKKDIQGKGDIKVVIVKH